MKRFSAFSNFDNKKSEDSEFDINYKSKSLSDKVCDLKVSVDAEFEAYRIGVISKFRKSLDMEIFEDGDLFELLMLMLFPNIDYRNISKIILEKYDNNLFSLISSDADKLLQDGVSEDVIDVLRLLRAITLRASKTKFKEKMLISSWQDFLKYLKQFFANTVEEKFIVFHVNKNLHLICEQIFYDGFVDKVDVNIREIVRKCTNVGSKYVVLAHNHPSGDPVASKEDMETTERIVNSLETIDVKVLDHLIIADNNDFSFKVNNII